MGSSFWLSYWSDQNSNDQIGMYLGVYAALGIGLAVMTFFQSILGYIICGMRAALVLHEAMLGRVMRAPMAFFDTTPYERGNMGNMGRVREGLWVGKVCTCVCVCMCMSMSMCVCCVCVCVWLYVWYGYVYVYVYVYVLGTYVCVCV